MKNQEMFLLIKIFLGTLIIWTLGCIYIGIQECGKIVLDKIKN
jgi:hypothetical protein